jgi:DNA-binding transcriptional regulator YiaG
LRDAGVMSAKTMREFDALCLPPMKKPNGPSLKLLNLVNDKGLAALGE